MFLFIACDSEKSIDCEMLPRIYEGETVSGEKIECKFYVETPPKSLSGFGVGAGGLGI